MRRIEIEDQNVVWLLEANSSRLQCLVHIAHAGGPDDTAWEHACDEEYAELRGSLNDRLTALIPPGSDAHAIAEEIVRIVDLPAGHRRFGSHVDPSKDGSHVVSVVYDRIRHEFYHRVGIEALLPADDAR